MSRSKWKLPHCSPELKKQVTELKNSKNSLLKTKKRSSMIIPQFVGVEFEIHNGRIWHKLKVTTEHVGYKFGDFSPTKSMAIFKKKNKARKTN